MDTLKKLPGSISPLMWLIVIGLMLFAGFSSNFYLLEVAVLVVIYMQFAASWDVLSGYTSQDNFGLAFFTGLAGYVAAIVNTELSLSAWITVPVSATVAAIGGYFIGMLALRLRGAYFSLLTIAVAAVLYKSAFIFSSFTGGEEGISGINTFGDTVQFDLFVCVCLLFVSVICLTLFAKSHYGLILRSTQQNEDAAIASGIDTAHYKIAGFVVSSFFAGVGGAMFAHTQMQVNPELLAISLSVLVVLLAVIGGRGTIVGPVIAAALLTWFNEWLRIIEDVRPIVFTGVLILLIYAFPSGLVNTPIARKYKLLRRFILGRGA